jgi:hypothetical protein
MRAAMSAVRAFPILLLACLALGSCGIFFVSPFPAGLSQTLAVRDFSSEIDDTSLDEFQPFVLESGGTRLILLVGGQLYPTDKPWLFVMREDLTPAQDPFTLADLSTIVSPFNGNRAMVDVNGRVAVGNALFDVTGAAITPFGAAGSMGGLYSGGFPTTTGGDNIVELGSTGFFFSWRRYDFSWNDLGTFSRQIRSPSRNLWLRNVFADPNPATTTVILAFEENRDSTTDTSTTYFVRVPRSGFNGSLANNFMDDTLNYPSMSKTELESSHMGFTSDGIVAYDYTSQSWLMFPFDAPNVVQSMYVGNISNELDSQSIAWSYSGGYACVYDKRSRTLSKVAAWWK